LHRFEGRLFAEGGCLFMVVHTDEAAESARVTCRFGDHTEVLDMPLAEVARRVSAAPLSLDNLTGPKAEKRLVEQANGWYFAAREGLMGPHESRQEASRALARYVLSMQGAGGSRRSSTSSIKSRIETELIENERLVGAIS
jgi:hypothetical protein